MNLSISDWNRLMKDTEKYFVPISLPYPKRSKAIKNKRRNKRK